MTTTLSWISAQFFDDNGDVLAGGKIYTYEAGTSTPQATFTDYGGLTANANPVILDASGRANIWMGANRYKFLIKTSADVTVRTTDDVGVESLSNVTTGVGTATNIASASVVDLGTVDSHFANITGVATITSFGSAASLTAPIYLVKFDDILTLTNSASLILPLGADILTVAQDRALIEYLGSGVWRLYDYASTASMTKGEIAIWDATGKSSTIPAETADYLLVSNGAGVPPTFQDRAATAAEIETGTDTGKFITPAGLVSAQQNFFHLREEQASGTAGGTFTSGSWQTRTLNTTKTNNITSASVSSNVISLPEGTYWVEATAPAGWCNAHQLRLQNTTDASTDILGATCNVITSATGAGVAPNQAILKGEITIAGTKSFELQHRCATTRATDGLGKASSWGTEVYAEIVIRKTG